MNEALQDYDPNYFSDSTHTVRVHLQSWEFKGHHDVTIKGNCKGAEILSSAIEWFVEDISGIINASGGFVQSWDDDTEQVGVWRKHLVDAEGNTLEWEVWGTETEVTRDLEKHVVGLVIIGFTGDDVEAARARRNAPPAEIVEESGDDVTEDTEEKEEDE